MSNSLVNETFVDLYLGQDFAEFKGWEGHGLRDQIVSVPAAFDEEIAVLRKTCTSLRNVMKVNEFPLTHEGARFRVTATVDFDNKLVYVLRNTTAKLRNLRDIGIAPVFLQQAMQPDLTGLVLIAGETGAGKTSTAVSMLVARMEAYGGVAVTVEDPPEIMINGRLGKGRCIQQQASRVSYKDLLVRALRMNPNLILLGEIRETETARAVLAASTNGHLIISTVHAGNVIEAIERLATEASGDGADPAAAYRKLANGLKLVIWQHVDRKTGKFSYEALSFIPQKESAGARSKLAAGKLQQLTQDIDVQQRRAENDPRGSRKSDWE